MYQEKRIIHGICNENILERKIKRHYENMHQGKQIIKNSILGIGKDYTFSSRTAAFFPMWVNPGELNSP